MSTSEHVLSCQLPTFCKLTASLPVPYNCSVPSLAKALHLACISTHSDRQPSLHVQSAAGAASSWS